MRMNNATLVRVAACVRKIFAFGKHLDFIEGKKVDNDRNREKSPTFQLTNQGEFHLINSIAFSKIIYRIYIKENLIY